MVRLFDFCHLAKWRGQRWLDTRKRPQHCGARSVRWHRPQSFKSPVGRLRRRLGLVLRLRLVGKLFGHDIEEFSRSSGR